MTRNSSSLATSLVLLLLIVVTGFSILRNPLLVHASPVDCTYLSIVPTVYAAHLLGETFETSINVSNVENLSAFEFKLGYNTTLLDAVQVVQGPFFPPPPKASIEKLEIDETAGFVWVSINLSGSELPRSGSGTLVTIIFNVTFTPPSSQKACGKLDLYDTMLYDNAMTSIIHDSIDGLYFWKSIQDDPPVDGLLLDLTTHKGGMGQGISGGCFIPGEMVELNACLTYYEEPVQGKLVGFEVFNPRNETVLIRVAITNNEGIATINFRIPSTSESLGTWTAVAVASVADKVVWDFLNFEVAEICIVVGGDVTAVSARLPTRQMDFPAFILAALVTLGIITYCRSRMDL